MCEQLSVWITCCTDMACICELRSTDPFAFQQGPGLSQRRIKLEMMGSAASVLTQYDIEEVQVHCNGACEFVFPV